jgi:hypothetical protein
MKAKKAKKKVKKTLTVKSRSAGRSKKSIKSDLKRKAKKAGKRTSASGREYTETRPEKSDLMPRRYKKIP